MKFSQRIGKVDINEKLQINGINENLKNRLWNVIHSFIFERNSYYDIRHQNDVFIYIWEEFFILPLDDIPTYMGTTEVNPIKFMKYTKIWFNERFWFELYDFIEFICELNKDIFKDSFLEKCNKALKKEGAGYRIIKDKVTQITSEEEIKEVEEVFKKFENIKPVYIHLDASLGLLSNRTNPDYRNSIKESISAVESFCRIITKNKKATLGDALNIIEQKYSIHKALKKAFSSLYGYTSDSNGIRHSLLENDLELKYEDAKFMFISCVSFINYLKVKSD